MRKTKSKTGTASYVDELEQWLQEQQTKTGNGGVAFVAVRGDVQVALERGYSLKTVWSHLHAQGRYQHRYETFLRHAAKHLPREAPTGAQVTSAGKPKSQEPPPAAGFSFSAAPNQEELI